MIRILNPISYASNNSNISGAKSITNKLIMIIKAKAILNAFNLSLFFTFKDINPPIKKNKPTINVKMSPKYCSMFNTHLNYTFI